MRSLPSDARTRSDLWRRYRIDVEIHARYSKDIDIFVSDPQTLGFVTPRLSDVAESITGKYVETSDYVKLFLPEGEIDFVAAPNLTSTGFEVQSIMGRQVKVKTSTEIIAKKLWHRGDQLTGRDIFDFARVTCEELDCMMSNSALMIRHYDAILEQIDRRSASLRKQFDALVTLNFHPTFDEATATLRQVLTDMNEMRRPESD